MIRLEGLTKTFPLKGKGSEKRTMTAVDRVDFEWDPSRFVALVGESGCGKSTLGRMIAGIIRPTGGRLWWDDRDVLALAGREKARWSRVVQLIPQDPYAAINPVRKIRGLFADPLLYHRLVKKTEVDARIEALLAMVGLNPANVIDKYPHQLSGGQRQRLVVARALTVEPQYLVADEAVSMVDVSLRIGIMDAMKRISAERGLGLLFITHDFRVARYIARGGTIAVMYLGRIVEQGPAEAVLQEPMHPYTQSLISAVPILEGKEQRIDQVEPLTYDLTQPSRETGCAFAPRCPYAESRCREETPILPVLTPGGHVAACHFANPRTLIAESARDIV